jgi:hypothetical protein
MKNAVFWDMAFFIVTAVKTSNLIEMKHERQQEGKPDIYPFPGFLYNIKI